MILGTVRPQYMWAVFMVITIFWPEASLRRRKPVWYSRWLTFDETQGANSNLPLLESDFHLLSWKWVLGWREGCLQDRDAWPVFWGCFCSWKSSPWIRLWVNHNWGRVHRCPLLDLWELDLCVLWGGVLWKCCTQYASKFGKLTSGHRTGKDQFSFQSPRKAVPNNAQTTTQFAVISNPSKVMLKFSMPGFNSTWTVNFQMFKLDLEKAEEPEIKLPISVGS